jgi:hypothetical protein
MARSMGRTDGHVITNGMVIVNIMFGVCIADCRHVPVRFCLIPVFVDAARSAMTTATPGRSHRLAF